MLQLLSTALATLRDRKGVTAMEYGVIAAGIVIVVAVAASNLGSALGDLFNSIEIKINEGAGG